MSRHLKPRPDRRRAGISSANSISLNELRADYLSGSSAGRLFSCLGAISRVFPQMNADRCHLRSSIRRSGLVGIQRSSDIPHVVRRLRAIRVSYQGRHREDVGSTP